MVDMSVDMSVDTINRYSANGTYSTHEPESPNLIADYNFS